MLPEFPWRLEQIGRGCELHSGLGKGERFAVVARQQWLGIKRIDVRRPPLHKQEDHPLGTGEEMGSSRCEGIACRGVHVLLIGQQRGESERAETDR